MKKKLLVGLLSLGMISLLSGFDSAQTADSVLDSMQQASAEADNMSMEMAMNLDLGVDVGDGTTTSTIAVAMDGGFKVDYILSPLSMMMDGSFSMSAMGQNQDMSMTMYMVTNEDGQVDSYVYTEDSTTGESGWTHSSADMGMDLDALMEMQSSITAADYAEWGLTFELAPEAADVNGTECYLLTTSIDSTTLSTMIDKVAELSGEAISDEDMATIDQGLAFLDGLVMNIEYYVDTATYLPIQMHMDFDGTDLSAINSLIAASMGDAAEGTTVAVNLNNLSIDATMSYGDVAEITVPQEAIDNAVEADETESLATYEDVISGTTDETAAAETTAETAAETETASTEAAATETAASETTATEVVLE